MPREETGANRFLAEHPDYDGRGITVAIFDSGVDPAAAGLRMTSTGKPKVIDVIDGTGSGDVDMSKTRKPAADGRLLGRSGRWLKIDPSWKNPQGEFHVGMKAGYDIFPADLMPRMRAERREAFEKKQRAAVEKQQRIIASFEKTHPKPNADQKQELAELRVQLDQLVAAGNSINDPGPIYDCVTFFDGNVWRAVVDSDDDSDLTDETPMTDFRRERQHGTFADALLNFAVNIYDNGRTLSIVADCDPHGTHVAGIVSAYYPEQPELCGVAPGAQIVSVKIGDSRLAGMETGAGLVRGLRAVVRNKCQLVNMSYGEPSSSPNAGRITEMLATLSQDHNVIFVSSAGNAGPALSTVGAPGGSTSDIIGVGAYVSPQMMKDAYSLRKDIRALPYSWTSRGPTLDGAQGVDIFAPGGAVSPVPEWTLNRGMRMNGTSMASPNTCGNLALVLSALTAQKKSWTPAAIRRAMQNTAKQLEDTDPYAQGPGLLQVDKLYQAIDSYEPATIEKQIGYEVHVSNRENARGIYLREAWETSTPANLTVAVKPIFADDVDKRVKVEFNADLQLECPAPWVTVGNRLLLQSTTGTFEVHVDPAKLEPGAHQTFITATLRNDSQPLFRVPVTVVKAIDVPENSVRANVKLQAGDLHRQFLHVPAGATWADITLKLREADEQRLVILHTVQLEDAETFEKGNMRKYVRIDPQEATTESIPVTGGRTLEVCLTQYWSSLGASSVDMHIDFHGLQSNNETISLGPDKPIARVNVMSALQAEALSPSAKLEHVRTTVPPEKSAIELLSASRDELPNGQTAYELTLNYSFEQSKKITGGGKKSTNIRFPLGDDMLYDSPFGHQLWTLTNEHGQVISSDDIWPDAVNLAAGTYHVELKLRHSNSKLLERFKNAPIVIERAMKTISVPIYHSRLGALRQQSKVSSDDLKPRENQAYFLSAPRVMSLPSWIGNGDVLVGHVYWGAENAAATGAGQRPSGYELEYRVAGRKQTAPKSPPKTLLAGLSKTADRSAFDAFIHPLLQDKPDDLNLLAERLAWLDHETRRKQWLSDVIAAADDVISRIDADQVALHLGRRKSKDRSKYEKQRKHLIDALYRKGRALGYMELPDVLAEFPIDDQAAHGKAFKTTYEQLAEWVNPEDSDYVLLAIRKARRDKKFGTALKLIQSQNGSTADYWLAKKRRDVLKKLNWTHLWEYARRELIYNYPEKSDLMSAEK